MGAKGARGRHVGNGPKTPGAALWSVLAHAAAPPPHGCGECWLLRLIECPGCGVVRVGRHDPLGATINGQLHEMSDQLVDDYAASLSGTLPPEVTAT